VQKRRCQRPGFQNHEGGKLSTGSGALCLVKLPTLPVSKPGQGEVVIALDSSAGVGG